MSEASGTTETSGTTDAEPTHDAPVLGRICARKRDWNAKCNGTEEHRIVRLPDGSTGWACDMGPTRGDWERRGFLASARHCNQSVEVPVGTVLVAFERGFRGGTPTGPATVTAGVVVGRKESGAADITWGLPYRRRGDDYEVTVAGETVVVSGGAR